jgi:hypothetical protein
MDNILYKVISQEEPPIHEQMKQKLQIKEDVQTDEKRIPLTDWDSKEKEEILIPATPNVECRDGKEIGVWMQGWLEGYKEAQRKYENKETFYYTTTYKK